MTGEQYKAERIKLQMTQKELAYCVGVTSKTISERERGLVKVGKEAAMMILMINKAK